MISDIGAGELILEDQYSYENDRNPDTDFRTNKTTCFLDAQNKQEDLSQTAILQEI